MGFTNCLLEREHFTCRRQLLRYDGPVLFQFRNKRALTALRTPGEQDSHARDTRLTNHANYSTNLQKKPEIEAVFLYQLRSHFGLLRRYPDRRKPVFCGTTVLIYSKMCHVPHLKALNFGKVRRKVNKHKMTCCTTKKGCFSGSLMSIIN